MTLGAHLEKFLAIGQIRIKIEGLHELAVQIGGNAQSDNRNAEHHLKQQSGAEELQPA